MKPPRCKSLTRLGKKGLSPRAGAELAKSDPQQLDKVVKPISNKGEAGVMTTYVMLANWTDQGVRNIGDSAKRWDAAKKMLEDMGGSIKDFYMTMGEYDLVLVYEAPDDAIAARFTLMLGRLGNVRTKTLKAFPEQAYRQIVNSLAQ
jgi:uncharacterized protein with GYD domain